MGMSVGGGKGPSATINVTPMIDVLLVLLIIFMLLIPTAPTGERALVPQPRTDTTPTPKIIDQTVVLQLTVNDCSRPSLKLNDDQVGWDDLKSRLEIIFTPRREKVIFVKGERKVNWNEVAQAIDVAHSAGILNVGLITDEMK